MWINSFFPFYTVTNPKKMAKFENDIEFQNTFFRLFNLTVNAFEWKNLPVTCNERYLESCLILNGLACIANDKEYGLLSLKAAPVAERYNMYGETDKLFGYGWNGFSREYTAYMYGSDNTDAQAVLCRDNPVCYPYVNFLISYANRLTNTMRSLDVASKKLKVPYYIVCDESQKASVEKVLNDIDMNKESIITSKATAPDMFQVLPTRIDPNVLTAYWNNYNNLLSQIESIIGIPHAINQDKKERLITDEVNGENICTQLSIGFRLKQRKLFAETVNNLFGTNIDVTINSQYGNKEFDEIQRMESEVSENGMEGL